MIVPKGKLIAIGGAEDKGTEKEPNFIQKNNLHFFELGILRRIVSETRKGADSHIEVITTASVIPNEIGDNYMQAFGKIGCRNVQLMHIRNREDALLPENIARIEAADAVMFTGGNQLRLSTVFGGTEIRRILMSRYLNENVVIAGTSAGAMAMSQTMIYLGSSAESHLKGAVKITTGLGFIPDVIIDSHFEKRGRFGRLAQAVISNPGTIGIGLGEDTGALITEGTRLEVIGSGPVVILDGHAINYTNLADIPMGTPLSAENLVVHFMTKGNCYEIAERKFYPGKTVIPFSAASS